MAEPPRSDGRVVVPEGRPENVCRCGRRRPIGVVLGMRSGARPRLDGQWFCRRECIENAFQERARRDFPEEGRAGSSVQHRVPLGLMLQARGVLTTKQLQEALRTQAETGCRLGDVLRTHFGIAEQVITGAIAAQWGLPVLHLTSSLAMPVQNIAPACLFEASGSFPVERTESALLLACAEGPDPSLALALERMYPLRVEFGLVSSKVLEQRRSLRLESTVTVQRVICADREQLPLEAAQILHRMQPVDSRLVRVSGMWWMRLWLEEAARWEHPQSGTDDTLDVLLSLA